MGVVQSIVEKIKTHIFPSTLPLLHPHEFQILIQILAAVGTVGGW